MKIFKTRCGIFIYHAFLILLLTSACDNETEYEPLYGQLTGYALLYDGRGLGKMSDHSGVEITLEGSSPQIKVSTDESGQFMIDGLKSGIYNVVFSKEGYCQHKFIGYQFVGGNQPASLYQTTLYSRPDFQIDSLVIDDYQSPYTVAVEAKVLTNDESAPFSCRYYVSNAADVSFENYISTDYRYSSSEALYFIFQVDTLKFPIGTQLYMIAYPAVEPYNYYIDIRSGKRIYTSINSGKPSNVAKITIREKDN